MALRELLPPDGGGTSLVAGARLGPNEIVAPLGSGGMGEVFRARDTRLDRTVAIKVLPARWSADVARACTARRMSSAGFAYDVYLRTRRDIMSFSTDRLDQACRKIDHALAVAGEDVLLYRARGLAHWQYINAGISLDPMHLDRAEKYARRILRLDPDGPHGPALPGKQIAEVGVHHRVDLPAHAARGPCPT